jgi:tetratricopeptide (TPR) repeat protein
MTVADNSRRSIVLAGLLLVVATVGAYSNSFNGPFVFDDIGTILDNPTIRQLLPPWSVLVGPPGGTTASGRPLVNLSLALNFAVGGYNPRGYHVVNLAIHLAAGLALLGVIRRTLLLEPLRKRFGSIALPIAFTCAALWLLHPLQTAAVTYLVQRAESLASLFYLLTLYGFIRATDSPRPIRWQIISVASCLFGMASKEIVVSAPLFVLLYDRTLVSGTFAATWRQRRGYYLTLASTWILLGALIVSTHGRGGSIGVNVAEAITPWSYALTQCRAIVHYLRLVVWPAPLIFDYGTSCETNLIHVWPQALLLVALALATGFSLLKRSAVGLAGAWFFAILAPSSSVVPIVTQTVAEHRMYLSLAAVVVLLVCSVVTIAGSRGLWIFFGAAALFGGITFQRNFDYRSAATIWNDTAVKLPNSKRAHNNLAAALFNENKPSEAMAAYQRALNLDPRYVISLANLGHVQLQSGMITEAGAHFERALAIEPYNAEALFGLGIVLGSTGRLVEGIKLYRNALLLKPDAVEVRLKLAQALFRTRDATSAIEQFRELIRQSPKLADAHTGLGTALASQGNFKEAERELTEALRLNPDDADAHFNLGNALAEQDRVAEAIVQFEHVLRLRPDHPLARETLEQARAYLRSLQ